MRRSVMCDENGIDRMSGNGPSKSSPCVSAVVAQPCRRRGVGQLSRRITRGCLTGARRVRRRETPGGGCTNTTCTHTHTLYAQRVVFAPSACTTRQLAPGPSLPLCAPTRSPSLPLLPSVLRPLVDPGDKGASATLCVGSGRLVSRIGRLFETASRVDIALVTNEKRKEGLFVLNHGYLESTSDARQLGINIPANQNPPLSTLIGQDTNRFITHSDGERAWIYALKTVLLKVDSSRKPVVTSNTANSTVGSNYWQEVVVNGKSGNF
ncbi:Uncharacterized protein DBV15_10413 [Temnothorax longispinosus]|uniref:Uncharacterized protein n=1 Tax=Temnothorax longispinosus TaxID=300112 RepID=A0A4S2JVA6_9HYME|nr:Uncharacterized protein DBV15_10413 [Temnothorax longispinosus]